MKKTLTFVVMGLQAARLRLVNDATGKTVQMTSPLRIDDFGVLRHRFQGLAADTDYTAILETIEGVQSPETVSFSTPPSGPHSFQFAGASCARDRSNALIFDNIRARAESGDMKFFMHMGDMHYRDETRNEEKWFLRHFREAFGMTRQRNCWAATPMAFMIDDHDGGPNDRHRGTPSRQAAVKAYRRLVPSPQLAFAGPEDSPHYAFRRGRVRFLVNDFRSDRAAKGLYDTNDARQVVWLPEHREWFFGQLMEARQAEEVICWVQTKRWIANTSTGRDTWGGYFAAKMEVADFITANNLRDSMFMFSGDLHSLAYDDGTSVNNHGDLHVCHAAPIDQTAGSTDGPFLIGRIPQDASAGVVSQYGLIDVTDTGGAQVGIRFRGIQVDRDTGTETEAIDVSFDLDAA